MKTIARSWWKILAVALMCYVIIVGFLVPLNSGIDDVNPKYFEMGKNVTLDVTGYNSNFQKAQDFKAYLWIDSSHFILPQKIEIGAYNQASLVFDLNQSISSQDSFVTASLYLDNEIDGKSVFPDALTVKNNFANTKTPSSSIPEFRKPDGMRFPFMNILDETVRNVFFHVAIWMALFVLSTVAMIYSFLYLRKSNNDFDHRAYAFTSISLLYGLLGLATGAVWAKFTWGAFWTNDVRLNMAAVSVLIYVGYFIIRSSIVDKDRSKRVSAALNIFAYFAMIPLLLVIPRMYDSLHPGVGGNPAFKDEDMDNTLRMVFYPAILGLILLGCWMANLRYRVSRLDELDIDLEFKD